MKNWNIWTLFLFCRKEIFNVNVKDIWRDLGRAVVWDDQPLKIQISQGIKLLPVYVIDIVKHAAILISSDVFVLLGSDFASGVAVLFLLNILWVQKFNMHI